MVDGSVVLCDDDAEGKKTFGNVFLEGIEKIWNGSLLEYHKKIYERNYSEDKTNLICNGHISESMPITTGLNYWDAPSTLGLDSWDSFEKFVTEEKFNDEWRFADDGPMFAAWYSITLNECRNSNAESFRKLINKLFTEQNAYFVTHKHTRGENISPCDESQTYALMRKSKAIEYLKLRGISNEIINALEFKSVLRGSFDFMIALFPKQNHPFGRRRPFINLIEGCDADTTHINRYLYNECTIKEICSYFPFEVA
jgi:hypothetical protein